MSTFLCIFLILYNTYLSSPHPRLFPIIFVSINPIKILLKPDCLFCLTLLPNHFTKLSYHFSKLSFTFLLNFVPHLYFSLLRFIVPWGHLILSPPPQLSITCSSDRNSVVSVDCSEPWLIDWFKPWFKLYIYIGKGCSSTML